jgi:hypothetical protein
MLLSLIAYLLFAASVGDAKSATMKFDRIWKNERTSCQKNDCAHLVPEEAYNCVNNCTSTLCYSQIYADSPLEDGEIDYDRSRKFTVCARTEARLQQMNKH